MENIEGNQKLNRIRLETEDYEMELAIRKLGNPADILGKLYKLRGNKDLSDEEKNEEVKKIIAEYLR
ncbi:MAG TPA: hypothetical protein GXX53_06830 [Tissierellia bacterium]|nr:hypothetical protein [Tissierellia bacterium]